MGAANSIPMIQEFPLWLSSVWLGNRSETVQARWVGVCAVAQMGGPETNEALLRIALKSHHTADVKRLAAIRDAFYSADNTFQMGGNDRELQVLAGAALAARMSSTGDIGAMSALRVASALAEGLRTADLPMDLSVLADSAMVRLSELARRRPDWVSEISATAPKVGVDKALAKAKEQNWEAIGVAISLVADATQRALSDSLARQVSTLRSLDAFLQAQDEELQMLWWLIGARSFEVNQNFDGIDPLWKPLLLGSELAGLTRILPGPRSIDSLLIRSGLKGDVTVGIAAAVNAADEKWLRSLGLGERPSPVTSPIHMAVERRLETGPGPAWVPGWAAATSLPESAALSSLALARLFYRESLARR